MAFAAQTAAGRCNDAPNTTKTSASSSQMIGVRGVLGRGSGAGDTVDAEVSTPM